MTIESAEVPSYSRDERILAALAQVSIILPMMGLIVPIIIWVTQKDKSRFVYFQSLQALVYHLLMVFIYMLFWACYLIFFFTLMVGMPLVTSAGNHDLPGVMGGLFFLPFLIIPVFLLVGSLYILYGIVGAGLCLAGKDFRYLVIGRMVQNYLKKDEIKNEVVTGTL